VVGDMTLTIIVPPVVPELTGAPMDSTLGKSTGGVGDEWRSLRDRSRCLLRLSILVCLAAKAIAVPIVIDSFSI